MIYLLSRLSECATDACASVLFLVSYMPLAINLAAAFHPKDAPAASPAGQSCQTFLCYRREIVIAAAERRRTLKGLSKQKLRFGEKHPSHVRARDAARGEQRRRGPE